MASFDRPVLVVWAREDRLMPRSHGPRLAALFRQGRLVEIDDSYTLIPEDQPRRLAAELARFVTTELPARAAEPARDRTRHRVTGRGERSPASAGRTRGL